MPDNTFLGRGWSFPPVFDKTLKGVVMIENEVDVRSSIEIILSTELGERIMQPGFGWKRDRWLFEALTTTSATAIQKEISDALTFYEPRINLDTIRILPGDKLAGKIEIEVNYTVRATNARENLVFPFYLKEV